MRSFSAFGSMSALLLLTAVSSRHPATVASAQEQDEFRDAIWVCRTPSGPTRHGDADSPPSLVMRKGTLWSTDVAITYFLDGGPEPVRARFRQMNREWREVCRLHFKEVPSRAQAQIRVGFVAKKGNWSHIGRHALQIDNAANTMNLDIANLSPLFQNAVILHELGHAIGFQHEHQNPKGGIQWNRDVVLAATAKWKWDAKTTEENIFKLFRSDSARYSEFDPESIMIYTIPKGWASNFYKLNENTELSSLDCRFGRDVYGARYFQGLELKPVWIRDHLGQFLSPNSGDLSKGLPKSAKHIRWGFRVHTVPKHGPESEDHEKFYLAERGDGTHYILTHRKMFLSVNTGDPSNQGRPRVHCVNWRGISAPIAEAFRLIQVENGKWAIQAYNGEYLSHNNGDKSPKAKASDTWGDRLHTVPHRKEFETFTIEKVRY